MIDYREVLTAYIKTKLTGIEVRDGSYTFKEPETDYVSFYILNEEQSSYVNNTSYSDHQTDATLINDKYTPLTVVTMSLDVRGENSTVNANLLRNSFDTISNKETLSSEGVFLMSTGAMASLPQLKNTKNQQGYIFDLVFNYDNSHIDEVTIADTVAVSGTIQIKE